MIKDAAGITVTAIHRNTSKDLSAPIYQIHDLGCDRRIENSMPLQPPRIIKGARIKPESILIGQPVAF